MPPGQSASLPTAGKARARCDCRANSSRLLPWCGAAVAGRCHMTAANRCASSCTSKAEDELVMKGASTKLQNCLVVLLVRIAACLAAMLSLAPGIAAESAPASAGTDYKPLEALLPRSPCALTLGPATAQPPKADDLARGWAGAVAASNNVHHEFIRRELICKSSKHCVRGCAAGC